MQCAQERAALTKARAHCACQEYAQQQVRDRHHGLRV